MKRVLAVLLMLCSMLYSSFVWAEGVVTISNPTGDLIRPVAGGTSIVTGQNTNVSSSVVAVLGTGSVTKIYISAGTTNMDNIYVGGATTTSTTGYQLSTGNTITIDVDNLNDVYVRSGANSTKTNNKVTYVGIVP